MDATHAGGPGGEVGGGLAVPVHGGAAVVLAGLALRPVTAPRPHRLEVGDVVAQGAAGGLPTGP